VKHDFSRAGSSHSKQDLENYYKACANECREIKDRRGYKKYMELIKCLKENMR
jgi:hypothetical protein